MVGVKTFCRDQWKDLAMYLLIVDDYNAYGANEPTFGGFCGQGAPRVRSRFGSNEGSLPTLQEGKFCIKTITTWMHTFLCAQLDLVYNKNVK